MSGIWYATREDVKSALDFKESARNDGQIDRALEAASRGIEGLLHRKFYPMTATRYFAWPNTSRSRSWRLWLDADEVISVTTLSSGGTTISAPDFFLEPVNSGPPYNRVEIDLASSASFNSGSTHQRNIAITGVFGYTSNSEPAGLLAEALDSSETSVDVSDSALIGVGSIILVELERMLVTGKTMVTAGQTLQTPMTAAQNNVTVAVTTGSAFHVGETILLDSERMLIVDIAGNNLTVKRAWDGTVLATHSGSTLYAPRTLSVVRGALGTTAATHADTTPVTRHVVPGLVRELALAEAINIIQGESSGFARSVDAGEKKMMLTGRGVEIIRENAIAELGRNARMRTV